MNELADRIIEHYERHDWDADRYVDPWKARPLCCRAISRIDRLGMPRNRPC
jgi:hypothetical protein